MYVIVRILRKSNCTSAMVRKLQFGRTRLLWSGKKRNGRKFRPWTLLYQARRCYWIQLNSQETIESPIEEAMTAVSCVASFKYQGRKKERYIDWIFSVLSLFNLVLFHFRVMHHYWPSGCECCLSVFLFVLLWWRLNHLKPIVNNCTWLLRRRFNVFNS